MNIVILTLMALLLVAGLERNQRRQPPQPPGLRGAIDRNDRDWARTQLELAAMGDQPTSMADQQQPPVHEPGGAGVRIAASTRPQCIDGISKV